MADQESIEAHVEHCPLPPVRGVPGLAQGVYGEAGNLELVVPGDDGLWVFWFNADPVDHHQGAVRDRWSGGLNFARGRRFRAATITQMECGPNFLEVLAVQDAGETEGDQPSIHRFYWTPVDGFVNGGVVATGVSVSPMLQDGPTALFTVTDESGRSREFGGDLTSYPSVVWQPDERTPDGPSDQSELLGHWPEHRFEAAACSTTLLDGGRIDAVLRAGDQLWHSWSTDLTGTEWGLPVLVESVVWRRAADGPIHRIS